MKTNANGLPKSKSLIKTLIITIGIAVCGICFCAVSILTTFGIPVFELDSPKDTPIIVDEPQASIKFNCDWVLSVTVNGKDLSDKEETALCEKGYSVELSEGVNNIKVVADMVFQDDIERNVAITFDKQAYDAKISAQVEQENQLKLQEQQASEAEKQRIENLVNEKGQQYCDGLVYWNFPLLSVSNGQLTLGGQKSGDDFTLEECKNNIRALINTGNEQHVDSIIKHSYWVGMSEILMVTSMGSGVDINETVGNGYKRKQYVYRSPNYTTYIYVENGVVTSYQK